ncbi:MAG TPA: SigE family RNA polymerase sigma factor [Streptosporangiaceae bacterium]|jgi:RNA polymerase sigma-70 factor (ECF subfamily)
MRNSQSFDEFYAGTVQRVTAQLYAMTGDRAEAEDVVQEAYARAWQRWERVAFYASPESWVRTVAYRASVSAWRKAVNRGLAHRRLGPDEAVPGVSEDYVALIAALRQISESQRRVVVLHYLVGLSVGEIARETGISPAAVKTRLSRGRQALSAQLSEVAAGSGPEGAASRA